jgi:alcohol dehydrogenase (NADP+)
MYKAKAYSAASATSPLASTVIPRREPTSRDVQIEILFCGICHSDLHQVRDEWSGAIPTTYPCVPGHEIIGRVTKVGAEVTKYKTGDIVGVGCISDSDRTCPHCRAGFEQFCPDMTWTYNSPDKHKTAPVTYGGYSESIVIDHDCVLRIPTNLNLAGAAPLLCAGITTYSPLRHANVGPGMKVGVVGLGGLGHMGVKLAKAMGALRQQDALGFDYWRHRRNPRHARLLRPAQHHRRCRGDLDPAGQRGLRADAQVGREIPLQHRHGLAQVLNGYMKGK